MEKTFNEIKKFYEQYTEMTRKGRSSNRRDPFLVPNPNFDHNMIYRVYDYIRIDDVNYSWKIIASDNMYGFKAMNYDMSCRNKEYDVGETYSEDVYPIPCVQGMHFCRFLINVFNYYPLALSRIFLVKADGIIVTNDDQKYCTNRLRIVKELTPEDIRSYLVNDLKRYFFLGEKYRERDITIPHEVGEVIIRGVDDYLGMIFACERRSNEIHN